MGRTDSVEELLPLPTNGKVQLKKQAYTALKRFLVSRSVVPGSFLSECELARHE